MTVSSRKSLRWMSAVKYIAVAADDVMQSQGNGKCVISEELIGPEKHPHPAVRSNA